MNRAGLTGMGAAATLDGPVRVPSRVLPTVLGVAAASVTAASAAAQGEAARWTFSGSLREVVADGFVAERGTQLFSAASASLGYTRVSDRSSFSGSAWVSGRALDNVDGRDALSGGLGFSGQTEVTRLTRVRYSVGASDGLNLDSLRSPRLVVPQIEVQSLSAALGLAYEVTPRTSWDVAFDGSVLRYRTDLLIDTSFLPADVLASPDVLEALGIELLPAGGDGADPLGLLASEGILSRDLDYWSWRAGTSLSHEISSKSTVRGEVGYRGSSSDLTDGRELDVSLGLRREISDKTFVGLSYGYRDGDYRYQARSQTFSVDLSKEHSRRFRIDLTLGLSRLEPAAGVPAGWSVVGGAGANWRFRRSSASVRYTRSRVQGRLAGRNLLTDVVYAGLGHTFHKRVTGSLFGYYRYGRETVATGYSFEDISVGASLGATLGRRGRAGLSYSLEWASAGGPISTTRSTLGVFGGYSRTWK